MPYVDIKVAGQLNNEQKNAIAKDVASALEKHAGNLAKCNVAKKRISDGYLKIQNRMRKIKSRCGIYMKPCFHD